MAPPQAPLRCADKSSTQSRVTANKRSEAALLWPTLSTQPEHQEQRPYFSFISPHMKESTGSPVQKYSQQDRPSVPRLNQKNPQKTQLRSPAARELHNPSLLSLRNSRRVETNRLLNTYQNNHGRRIISQWEEIKFLPWDLSSVIFRHTVKTNSCG